jgi:hypothetical protein
MWVAIYNWYRGYYNIQDTDKKGLDSGRGQWVERGTLILDIF